MPLQAGNQNSQTHKGGDARCCNCSVFCSWQSRSCFSQTEWLDSSEVMGSPFFLLQERDTEATQGRPGSIRLYLLTVTLSVGAALVLFLPEWAVPASSNAKYWNGLVAF